MTPIQKLMYSPIASTYCVFKFTIYASFSHQSPATVLRQHAETARSKNIKPGSSNTEKSSGHFYSKLKTIVSTDNFPLYNLPRMWNRFSEDSHQTNQNSTLN